MLGNTAIQNTKAMVKWQADLNLDLDENLGIHFNKLYCTTDDSKLLNFHFKLSQRIIYKIADYLNVVYQKQSFAHFVVNKEKLYYTCFMSAVMNEHFCSSCGIL